MVCIVAALLWWNRYDILENRAQKELEQVGIQAQFDIESINSTRAIINEIRFAYDGKEFLAADQLKVDYTIDKIRAGQVDKIVLTGPELTLTFSEDGTIVDKWLPAPSDNEDPIDFPDDGIFIENGRVNWRSPFGTGHASVDGDIQSASVWQAKIKTDTGAYKSEDIDLTFAFDGNINRTSETEMTVAGLFKTDKTRISEMHADGINAVFELDLNTENKSEDLQMSGTLDLKADALFTPSFSIQKNQSKFEFDGILNRDDNTFSQFISNWEIDASQVALIDPQMRERMVHRTMSFNALSNTPIAMHFVDGFERNGKVLLSGFDFSAGGTYVHDPNGYSVEFSENAILSSNKQKVVLIPGPGPELNYSSVDNILDIDTDVEWSGGRKLTFSNLVVTALSENGILLAGVQSVKSRIQSHSTWTTSKDSETFRLAPIDLELVYIRRNERGQVHLAGDIDYDGDVPGGTAKGLLSSGQIKLDLNGDAFKLAYDPTDKVRITEFVSSTGWRAENVEFLIEDAQELLAKSNTQRPLDITLKDIKADIISPEDDRHLAAQFDKMRVRSDFLENPQKWDLDVEGIEMHSEDFPSPGTHILSPAGTAFVYQYADGHIEFEIDSPSTRVETENADIRDLSIQIAGLPDDFTAEYTAGTVKLKGSEMPELPMGGTARLANGELTGSATAHLPESKDTPIFIEYRSIEGIGSANIKIPKIVFEPRGLQPQYVIPALRGRLAEVSGEASAEFEFAFSGGGPVSSFGSTELKNMQIGTIVGPFTGVNADLTFDSIFPLQTDGVQTATLSGFDPGFALNNGTVKFEMVPEGIRIDQALWPVISAEQEKGQVYVEPLLWKFGNVENRAVVQVENLSLGDIVDGLGNKNLSATGQISGTMPVRVNGVEVEVDGGILSVKDGGVISYKSQGIDTFVSDVGEKPFFGDQLEGAETGFAFKALENLHYKELEVRIDGPLDGEMSVFMAFDGKNPDVFYGAPFSFNVTISGELANIIRNTASAFSSDNHIDRLLELKNEDGAEIQE